MHDTVVIGAGVFGAWASLLLQERGHATLLLDAWGVAHARATSGGESRVIRAAYGELDLYTDWAWKALGEWKRRAEQWDFPFFVQSGVLWLGRQDDPFLQASRRALQERNIPHQDLSPPEAARRYPQFSFQDVEEIILEPEAGVLLARDAVQRVVEGFIRLGGEFQLAQVRPPRGGGSRLERVELADGEQIQGKNFLFACGPWLPALFPELLGERIRVSRQEVFFFGPPAAASEFTSPRMPVWVDFVQDRFYGIPATRGRGVKVASDLTGPPFDPSQENRWTSPQEYERVRAYLSVRCPALTASPLVETRVCQYERTPNHHLVVDRHPQWSNVVLAGGGSGHGFKLGPSVAELAANLLEERQDPPAEVRL